PPLAAPTAQLDSATVTGSTVLQVSKFLGIPFAQPPALSMGPACPQQAVELPILQGLPADVVNFVVNTIYAAVFPDDEDCLTINVFKPASATPGSKLPVVAWIFGGGFELGSPQMYDGAGIVERSIQLGQPVIYVSMNYRVT
ncbi:hypothetical protein MPER_07056, partial [Moniliophthora perniciosa FA553]